MARSAVALSISTTPAERKLIQEYSELTGENPTQLVRHLVFARLPHIVAALRELRAAGVDATAIPDFDYAPDRQSEESLRDFYSSDATTWPAD
jgi:hypothetical protein